MEDTLPNPEVYNAGSSNLLSIRKILLFLGVILFLLSLSANIYLYTVWQRSKTASLPASAKINSSVDLSLPFSITDGSVSMAGIAYQLQGKIWGLTKKGTAYEIVLEGKDGKVYKDQPLVFKTATSSAKKILPEPNTGDSISLNYYYDLLRKIGYVTRVEITK